MSTSINLYPLSLSLSGTCSGNGYYYQSLSSFVICRGPYYASLPCAPGTMNYPLQAYPQPGYYRNLLFCTHKISSVPDKQPMPDKGVDMVPVTTPAPVPVPVPVPAPVPHPVPAPVAVPVPVSAPIPVPVVDPGSRPNRGPTEPGTLNQQPAFIFNGNVLVPSPSPVVAPSPAPLPFCPNTCRCQ